MNLQPHGALRQLAPGLHCVEGAFGRSPLGRRMTVITLPSGALALHSAIRMDEAGMAALDALGPVAAVIVPTTFHSTDAPWFAARYPAASLLAPRSSLPRLGKRLPTALPLDEGWSDDLAGALAWQQIEGARHHEAVFFHAASRTLILTDLVFNLGAEFTGLSRLLLRINGIYGRFGPSRLLRYGFVRDKAALLDSVRRMEAWDYDRIVMSHGEVLEGGGKARLREAFAPWGL